MVRKLLVLILLVGFGWSLQTIPAAEAATSVSAIVVTDVIFGANTSCSSGPWTWLDVTVVAHMVGSGDPTTNWAWRADFPTTGVSWQFGPYPGLPINTDIWSQVVYILGPHNQSVQLTFYWPDDPSIQTVVIANCDRTYLIVDNEHVPAFNDGRINTDPGQHATVYCRSNGIDIWYYDTQHFFVSQEQIDAVPTNPAENTLIASDGVMFLYRLAGGWFQVNLTATPNPGQVYGVRWDACPHTSWEAFEFYP